MSPSVSVVIPTFNRPEEVMRAARSVLAQTVPVHEIIVVDDASATPPGGDLTALDDRIRVIRHEVNGGGGKARNTGIDAASGTWVALLDSDDHWLPHKLERQLASASDPHVPGRNVIACNVLMRRPTGEERPFNSAPKPDDVPLSEWFLLHGGTYQTSGLLLGAEFARQVQFDPRLRKHQDWDFLLRLEAAGARFVYDQDHLVVFESAAADRVSKTGGYQRTLDWFAVDPGLISPRARLLHYLKRGFNPHRLERPGEALSTLVRYTLAYPGGVAVTARHFAGKLGGRAGS